MTIEYNIFSTFKKIVDAPHNPRIVYYLLRKDK